MPLTADGLSSTLTGLIDDPPDKLAVAVSGGADSMALLHLAKTAFPGRICILTVDHQLRPEAAEEAAFVAEYCQELDLPHHTLVWTDGPSARSSAGNLQAQARSARYDLMTAWCKANDVSVLLTAHHASDQAETVLLNLARGSGVDGLAAIPGLRDLNGVQLVRPLLNASKAELEQFCQDQNITWVTDPSNNDVAYDRIRLRKASVDLAALGLNEKSLKQTADHMARARTALEFYASAYLSEFARLDCAGGVSLSLGPLLDQPQEIQLRVSGRVLKATGARPHRPDVSQLTSLLEALEGQAEGKTTLGGALVTWGSNRAMIRREARHLPGDLEVTSACTLSWDSRAHWEIDGLQRPLIVKGLEVQDWAAVGGKASDLSVPAELRPTVPAIYDSEGPVAVPVMDYWRESATKSRIACNWSPLEQRLGLRTAL